MNIFLVLHNFPWQFVYWAACLADQLIQKLRDWGENIRFIGQGFPFELLKACHLHVRQWIVIAYEIEWIHRIQSIKTAPNGLIDEYLLNWKCFCVFC